MMHNPLPSALTGVVIPDVWRIFVRGLVVAARIGVYGNEKLRPQKLCINVELTVSGVARGPRPGVAASPQKLALDIEMLAASGHVNLVETLAERIAQLALAEHGARSVRVRVEKLEALANAAGAGVEIERLRPGRG